QLAVEVGEDGGEELGRQRRVDVAAELDLRLRPVDGRDPGAVGRRRLDDAEDVIERAAAVPGVGAVLGRAARAEEGEGGEGRRGRVHLAGVGVADALGRVRARAPAAVLELRLGEPLEALSEVRRERLHVVGVYAVTRDDDGWAARGGRGRWRLGGAQERGCEDEDAQRQERERGERRERFHGRRG